MPGPSALTAALSVSGLPTDRFCFEGFLPAKRKARLTTLQSLAKEQRTLVFFESVHRIKESLQDLCEVFGEERLAFIGREISKLHEQSVRDSLHGLLERVTDGRVPLKGEFVVCVSGSSAADDGGLDEDFLLKTLMDVLPGKQAAAVAARLTGGRRNSLYERMLQLAGRKD